MEKHFEFQLVRANVRVKNKVICTLTFLGNDWGVGSGITILIQAKAFPKSIIDILNRRGYIRDRLNDGLKSTLKGVDGECMTQVAISTPRGIRVPQHFMTNFAREIGAAVKDDTNCEKIMKEYT